MVRNIHTYFIHSFFLFPFFFFFHFSFISHFSIFWIIQLDWHCLSLSHSTLNDSTKAEYMSHVAKRAKQLMRQSFIFYSYFWCAIYFFPMDIRLWPTQKGIWTPEIKLPKHFLALHKLYYTWYLMLYAPRTSCMFHIWTKLFGSMFGARSSELIWDNVVNISSG